jgi:hypothetical protein
VAEIVVLPMFNAVARPLTVIDAIPFADDFQGLSHFYLSVELTMGRVDAEPEGGSRRRRLLIESVPGAPTVVEQ